MTDRATGAAAPLGAHAFPLTGPHVEALASAAALAYTLAAARDERNRRDCSDRWIAAALAVLAEAERLHLIVPVTPRSVRAAQERELRRDSLKASKVNRFTKMQVKPEAPSASRKARTGSGGRVSNAGRGK